MADNNSIRRNRCFIDLTGQRFGKWTVIDEAVGHKPPLTYWNVLCDCGRQSIVHGPAMTRGRSSCCTSCRGITHGKSRSPEYTVWLGMKQRCNNPLHKQSSDYSDRGISVCSEWDSFEVFYADMGRRPSPKHTLERKDNALGYSQDNCKWATWEEQSRNKRSNRLVTAFGKTQCLADWAAECGLHYKTLQNRIKRGWAIEKALNKPADKNDQPHKRQIAFNGKTMSLAEWSKETGISKETIRERLLNGWEPERALTQPVRSLNRSKS